MEKTNLYDLIQMDSPEAVMDEVETILSLIPQDINCTPVKSAFRTTVDLYEGRFPGYRACNTMYHDLNHITDTFLAMARLLHGAVIEGESLSNREIVLSLMAALFHDAGYIQENPDIKGTGSKYTIVHVRRSMKFFRIYGEKSGFSEEEIAKCLSMILCTDLAVDIRSITFISRQTELLGKMLGVADLLAQMADRKYLEKLLFLYHEFEEGMVDGYEGEIDLLHKSVGFYDLVNQRIATALGGVNRFILPHLKRHWNIHVDLYQEAIENQKNYLHRILKIQNSDPRDYLRRDQIVAKVRKEYGGNDAADLERRDSHRMGR